VNLSNLTNSTIATGQGAGTILDDDGPTMSIGNVAVAEGNSGFTNAVFTVTLSAPSPQDIFVVYVTLNDTAISGLDYQRVLAIPSSFPREQRREPLLFEFLVIFKSSLMSSSS